VTVAFVLEVKAGNTLSCLVTNSHANAGGSSNPADGPPPYPGMPGCYPTQPANVLYMFYLVLVIFEFGVFCPLVSATDLSLSIHISYSPFSADSSQRAFVKNVRHREWFVQVAVS